MNTTPTLAQKAANLAVRVSRNGLETKLRDDTVSRVVDVLGNSLAAAKDAPGETVSAVVNSWSGYPVATVIGSRTSVPAPSAALVNGTLAHSLDFDDTHLPSVLHPSSAVIPAALAVAEQTAASGTALLDAATVGIEITCRLGMVGYDSASKNSIFFERGLHATAICGAVGASVAAGMLYELSQDQITSAIGIACSMGAGVVEANRTGGSVKPVHCGWAAHCGVVAADLARHGLTGPPTVLEGRFGFLRAFCGSRADPERFTADLGHAWETPKTFFKPYPCNHFTHAGIDAALRMRAAGISEEMIESLTLGVPDPVLRTIAEPTEEKARPRSGYHSAFSGPYTVASALLGGGGLGVFHEEFTDEAASDRRRLALAEKVTCVSDPECTRIFPMRFPAVLTAELTDGSRWTEQVWANRGGPESPLTISEINDKFLLNAQRVTTPNQLQCISEKAWRLREDVSVCELAEELRFQLR